MIEMPELKSFLSSHSLRMVELDGISLYFSFETLVAFKVKGSRLTVVQNHWSSTTQKHLSIIDGGGGDAQDARLPLEDFKNAFNSYFG